MTAARFRAVRLDDVESVPIIDDRLLWRPLRATLGIRAFGINAYTAPQAGDLVVEEHDETGAGAGGHEELYVVVAGHARFTLDGQELDAPRGTCVFLPDPAVMRTAVALEPATTVLAVGGERGEPYRVSPWEFTFHATRQARAGELDRALATVEEGLAEHPGNPALLYDLACFEIRADRPDDALGHLRAAVDADPEQVRRWADGDAELDPLRGREDFPL